MIKPHSCIYLIPLYPLFNREKIINFDSFTPDHSVELSSALYLNLKELADSISSQVTTVFCFDEGDRNYILPEFSGTKNVYLNLQDLSSSFRILSEKFFNGYNNNLIVFVGTISISYKEILRYLDLLNREDESFTIGRSHNNKVSYIGFNIYNQDLFHQLQATGLKFENVLHLVCRFDYFINVLNGALFIENLNDFRILYKELSRKESINYCSHRIHEKFTHLFIEYKELLK